jgi:hypothetical protein
MSKKPAELSSNLVAIKGAAMPAPDMPGRISPATTGEAAAAKTTKGQGGGREELTPLNFRIAAPFRREFKTYAATHDLKLNELLKRSFEAYRKMHGD